MKGKMLSVVCACLVLLLSVSGAQAAKIMKIGHGLANSHFIGQAMHKFKAHVEEATNGGIVVELYPAIQLGSDREVMESIKVGVAHMNLPSPSVVTNFVKDFSIISLPFIFSSQKAANTVADGSWGQGLLKKLEDAGFVGLGFGDFGFREMTNNVRPVARLEDFKDLKIRTMQNPTHLATFRALGANPTAMAWSEVFTALQQGVIDGQENPLMQIYTFKLNEVQKYLTLTDHCYDMVVFVIGKKWYDSLSADEKKALQEATEIAKDHMRKSVIEEDAKALEGIRAGGTQVTIFTPDEKKRVRDAAMVEVTRQGEKINKELFHSMMEAIEAVGD
jgi:tripartite ATP-independent transporter DctP family solute receptor